VAECAHTYGIRKEACSEQPSTRVWASTAETFSGENHRESVCLHNGLFGPATTASHALLDASAPMLTGEMRNELFGDPNGT